MTIPGLIDWSTFLAFDAAVSLKCVGLGFSFVSFFVSANKFLATLGFCYVSCFVSVVVISSFAGLFVGVKKKPTESLSEAGLDDLCSRPAVETGVPPTSISLNGSGTVTNLRSCPAVETGVDVAHGEFDDVAVCGQLKPLLVI